MTYFVSFFVVVAFLQKKELRELKRTGELEGAKGDIREIKRDEEGL